MSYRISYGPRGRNGRRWGTVGFCIGAIVWCTVSLVPVLSRAAAGEGLYDALARYVGEMILGAH